MNELTVDFPRESQLAASGRWPRQYSRVFLYLSLVVADSGAIFLAFSLAAILRGEIWLSPGGVNLGLVTIAIYLMIAVNQGAFTIESLRRFSEGLRRPLMALFFTALLVVLFAFFTQSGMKISRLAFGAAILGSAFAILIVRFILDRWIVKKLRSQLTDEILILDGGDSNTASIAKLKGIGRGEGDLSLYSDVIGDMFNAFTRQTCKTVTLCADPLHDGFAVNIDIANSNSEHCGVLCCMCRVRSRDQKF